MNRRYAWPAIVITCVGFTFLYVPLFTLVAYSFNESQRVTMWTRFSTRWYTALADSQELIDATLMSVKIATLSATLAAIVGTAAAIALARYKRFRSRGLLTLAVTVPLATPEVLIGFSLLLLFVGLGIERGVLTVVIAHATLGIAYVVVVVQARLANFDHSMEEAAADLGARPIAVFRLVTLPLLMPGLVAGWLLTFVLSLDDLVLANFVNGPGTSTLPMVVFGRVRTGLSPEVNALAAIFIAFVAITLAVVLLLERSNTTRAAAQD
jgi:putrescine transport system permease protein